MRRRRFAVTVASWAAALPGVVARAQSRTRVALLLVAFDENAPAVMLFRDRLHSLGHVEGRNVDLQFFVARGPLSFRGDRSRSSPCGRTSSSCFMGLPLMRCA